MTSSSRLLIYKNDNKIKNVSKLQSSFLAKSLPNIQVAKSLPNILTMQQNICFLLYTFVRKFYLLRFGL